MIVSTHSFLTLLKGNFHVEHHLEKLHPLRISDPTLSNFRFEAFCDVKMNISILPESQSYHISPEVGTEDDCQSVENNQEG